MLTIRWDAEAVAARNARLLAAERDRTEATRDAEIEYSETVTKIREHYETELAEAGRLRLARNHPGTARLQPRRRRRRTRAGAGRTVTGVGNRHTCRVPDPNQAVRG